MDNTNIIVVPEDRQTIENVKGKKNKIQQAYQEKIVDSGVSDKMDKTIDTINNIEKVGIGVIGGVATVALALCPVDGPVGEICSALATPALIGAVQLKADIEKKVYHTVKGAFEKKVMEVDKDNDNVVVYNDQGEIMNDFMAALSTAEQLEKQLPQSRGVAA